MTVVELIIHYCFCIHNNSIVGEGKGGRGNCTLLYLILICKVLRRIQKSNSLFKIEDQKETYEEKTHLFLTSINLKSKSSKCLCYNKKIKYY